MKNIHKKIKILFDFQKKKKNLNRLMNYTVPGRISHSIQRINSFAKKVKTACLPCCLSWRDNFIRGFLPSQSKREINKTETKRYYFAEECNMPHAIRKEKKRNWEHSKLECKCLDL